LLKVTTRTQKFIVYFEVTGIPKTLKLVGQALLLQYAGIYIFVRSLSPIRRINVNSRDSKIKSPKICVLYAPLVILL